MDINEFNALSDEQKTAYLSTIDAANKQIEDLTAERDSFKNENDSLKESAANTAKELKATKNRRFYVVLILISTVANSSALLVVMVLASPQY